MVVKAQRAQHLRIEIFVMSLKSDRANAMPLQLPMRYHKPTGRRNHHLRKQHSHNSDRLLLEWDNQANP